MKIEQTSIGEIFVETEDGNSGATLTQFRRDVETRWQGIVDPKNATIQELNPRFYKQYADRESRFFKSLMELCVDAYLPLKKDYATKKVMFKFNSPKDLFNHLLLKSILLEQSKPSKIRMDLFKLCSQRSTKGVLRDRWEDFQLATVRLSESLKVYRKKKAN